MPATDETLRALWARASTLDERLSGDFLPAPGGEAEAEQRWAAWQSLAAEGDACRMARRLAFDGLDEAHVRSLLGAVVARSDAALPPEFELLAEALAGVGATADPLLDEVLSRMPFGEVLEPFLRAAQRRLDGLLGGQAAAALRLGCARGLAERLCEQAGPTLAALFEAERERQLEGCYQRLMQHTTGAAAAAFWHMHAALARALALAAHHWVAASAEMLQRWQADADALVQAFGPRAQGLPVGLKTGLGDPHRGGRTVARLRFESGLELYYKPRSLALDQAYADLLERLRASDVPEGLQVDLQVPALLARPGYGWVEGVAPLPARDADAVERHFERGGALLCLAHLLDITDCHSGNVIAVGEHPVLIDLETVCHQRARDLDERYSDAERRARQTLAASVLGCGLLPEARIEGELRVELGGLSPGPDAVLHTEVTHWVDLGQDSMRLEASPQAVGEGAHQLMLDGSVVSVRDHGAALRRGFTRMACQAMAKREAWCTPGGPLDALAACEARFVFRGTLVYGALLNRFTAPDFAQQGVDRSLLLEALCRPLLDADMAPSIWPLLAAERAAMARLDVPHFHAPVAEAVLHVEGGGAIAGYLQDAGIDRLRGRLMGFGEADLARELGFIDSALVRPLAGAAVAPPVQAAPPVDAAALRAAAMELVERLEATAVWGDDGSATWLDASLDARHDCLSWRTLPPWLGDGVAGLACVLAALERSAAVAERVRVRRLRQGAQRHLALGLAQIASQPLGGVTGAPSVAYALAHVAALTGDRSALELAGRVVAGIPLQAIAADEVLDVVGGVAGTLLCLAAARRLAEEAGETALVQAATLRIRACAARLAEAGAASPGSLLPTVAGRVLTGLSHGQSGFALAIARLREDDGAAALQPLARAALAFERGQRDLAAGNWFDLRPGVPDPCSCAWCHGAPGIGLVRAVLRAQGRADAALAEDLRMAARSTAAEPDAVLDHLCCGNLGLVACTQQLAEALDDPALMESARQRAGRVMARAQARGGYALLLGAPARQQGLGLFTGLAGASYALLRLAEPGLPAVLTLD
ncbi:type 2 lanthipeptide synthetase LanM [Roseateles sp. NT4]|uniref:type 2 lanthipeptide synthetase LanM n=1 Tax=Roseateles sp. NT4 TaxID=3453715 RepID=UPI003EEB4A4C